MYWFMYALGALSVAVPMAFYPGLASYLHGIRLWLGNLRK